MRLFRNDINIGFANNLNKCLEYSQGEFIIFLCDDDEFMPGILETEKLFLDANKEVGLVSTAGYYIRYDQKSSVSNQESPKIINKGDDAVTKILTQNNLIFSSVMIRRECFTSYGKFLNSCSPDWEMWARIGKNYNTAPISAVSQWNV